jgi:hypothetical protein
MGEIKLPVYLVRDNGIFASTEVTLVTTEQGYSGFVSLEASFIPYEIVHDYVIIPLCVVYDARGRRKHVCNLKLNKQAGDRFDGFVTIDNEHADAMSTARSLTNDM